MKIWKIISITFVGFLFGCMMFNIKLSGTGIFQQWDKVSDAPEILKTYFSAPHQCDFSTSEFFSTTNPPQNIVDCTQEKVKDTPDSEVVLQITYVRDSNGQVWGWYHSDYMAPGGEQIYFWPILGLIGGFGTSLFLTRSAKTSTANT